MLTDRPNAIKLKIKSLKDQIENIENSLSNEKLEPTDTLQTKLRFAEKELYTAQRYKDTQGEKESSIRINLLIACKAVAKNVIYVKKVLELPIPEDDPHKLQELEFKLQESENKINEINEVLKKHKLIKTPEDLKLEPTLPVHSQPVAPKNNVNSNEALPFAQPSIEDFKKTRKVRKKPKAFPFSNSDIEYTKSKAKLFLLIKENKPVELEQELKKWPKEFNATNPKIYDEFEKYKESGMTLLDQAAKVGNTEVIKLILEYSLQKNDPDKAQAYIDKAFEVALKNNKERAFGDLLIQATKDRKFIVAKALIGAGVNVDAANMDGMTALHCAAQVLSIDMISALLEAKADVNKANLDGETPLILACQFSGDDQAKCIEKLLEYKADINAANNQGSALHYAVLSENINCIKLLLDRGAKLDTTDFAGNTPLHIAAERGNIEMFKLLVEKGASLVVKNGKGLTPLDTTDFEGNTPLHIAAERGNIEMFKLLVEKGASLDVKNGKGLTPLELGKDNPEIITYLREHRDKQSAAQLSQRNLVSSLSDHKKVQIKKSGPDRTPTVKTKT